MSKQLRTVDDYINALMQFPAGWPVVVDTKINRGIYVWHREKDSAPVVVISSRNLNRYLDN